MFDSRSNPLNRTERLKVRRDILQSRIAGIRADMGWYATRHQPFAVKLLKEQKRKYVKKLERLQRRIDRVENKYANQGRHVLNPKYKEKTDG